MTTSENWRSSLLPQVSEVYCLLAKRDSTDESVAPSPVAAMVDFAQQADGVVVTTSYAIEHDAVKACKEFVNVVPVGIAVTPTAWTGSQLEDRDIKAFLDSQVDQSVLLICFG